MLPIGFQDLQVMENYSSRLLVREKSLSIFLWGAGEGRGEPNEIVVSNKIQSHKYYTSISV